MTPERIAELREIAIFEERIRPHHRIGIPIPELRQLLDAADALLAECERLWTPELPKQSGWYWWRESRDDEHAAIGKVAELRGRFEVAWPSGVWEWVEDAGGEWSGPLTPPQQAGARP